MPNHPLTFPERHAAGQACLDAALTLYLPLGFSVLCCCDPDHVAVGKNHALHCDSPGKAPIHKWKEFQTRAPTPAEVTIWWHDYPLGNIGCALGQVSGLVRVDVDGPAGEALLAESSGGDVPPTWTFQSSPGSRGLLYAWPKDQLCRSTTQKLPGEHRELRLMGNGSQTVLPPSRHSSGSWYAWLPGLGPGDCVLAMAPAWLQARLQPAPEPERTTAPQASMTLSQERVREALDAMPSTGELVGYDQWLTVGMALHSTGADWSRDLWEDWSRASPKYDGVKQEKSWQSFQGNGGVSLGSLYHLARQAGWRLPPEHLDGTVLQRSPHEADTSDGGVSDTDEAYLRALLRHVQAPDGGGQLLFAPDTLQRLQRIAKEAPGLYNGLLLPRVRAMHIWVPTLTEAMATAQTDYDPFVFVDAATILDQDYPPQRWLVDGLIADGLTMLGGSPKSGKSYLAYALALAVCRKGLWCQEWAVDAGPVTYVALEDEESDTFQRLNELAPGVRIPPGMLRFVHGITNVPSFGEGFLDWVEQTLQAHTPRLLIIDPISYLYVLKKNGGQFEETKDMLFPLRWLGKKYQCAIVCVDHRRKRSRDDISIFDTLHGSIAKIAVADGLLMVDREDNEITIAALIRRGRDQTLHLQMSYDQGQMLLTSKGESTVKTSSYGMLRQAVYTVLTQAQNPVSLQEIADLMECPDTTVTRNAIRKVLTRGMQAKEVERTSRDRYLLFRGDIN